MLARAAAEEMSSPVLECWCRRIGDLKISSLVYLTYFYY